MTSTANKNYENARLDGYNTEIKSQVQSVIAILQAEYDKSQNGILTEDEAKKEAVEIAKKYANLEEADHFYWFTRKKTYFSLTGTNDKGKEIAVIIPKSGEKVKVLDQTKGLTENEAKQTIATAHPEIQIEKAALGMYDDQPVWEVVGKETNGKLNYYLIGFESGDEVKTIKGI